MSMSGSGKEQCTPPARPSPTALDNLTTPLGSIEDLRQEKKGRYSITPVILPGRQGHRRQRGDPGENRAVWPDTCA